MGHLLALGETEGARDGEGCVCVCVCVCVKREGEREGVRENHDGFGWTSMQSSTSAHLADVPAVSSPPDLEQAALYRFMPSSIAQCHILCSGAPHRPSMWSIGMVSTHYRCRV